MTKKDYQALAGALYRAQPELRPASNDPDYRAQLAMAGTWRDSVDRIAGSLAADNPRFDRATFVLACEDGNVGRQPRTVHKRARLGIPLCIHAMGCYCAGHARGNPAIEPCDTRES